ncbi:MAG: hypothetical protein ACRC2T_02480 [Thermoguttaceae bacterium]
MLERIKNILSGLGMAWKYGDIIHSVTTAWSAYPGLDDPDMLRLWIRPILLDVSTLTTLTPTPIDDIVALSAIRLIDNNHTWSAIHSLALLGRDGGFVDGVRIPQDQQVSTASELLEMISSESAENPALVLSAIGLILYLLQQRGRK